MNVITSNKFTGRMTEDTLRELRSSGMRVADAVDHEAILGLDLPGAGEKPIGEITTEEAMVFTTLIALQEEFDKLNQELSAKGLKSYASKIVEQANLIEQGKSPEYRRDPEIMEKEDMLRMFELQMRMDTMQRMFFLTLSNRLQCHDWIIGVRRAGVVVKIHRKW